jgi:hypothetical protein
MPVFLGPKLYYSTLMFSIKSDLSVPESLSVEESDNVTKLKYKEQ